MSDALMCVNRRERYVEFGHMSPLEVFGTSQETASDNVRQRPPFSAVREGHGKMMCGAPKSTSKNWGKPEDSARVICSYAVTVPRSFTARPYRSTARGRDALRIPSVELLDANIAEPNWQPVILEANVARVRVIFQRSLELVPTSVRILTGRGPLVEVGL